MSYKELILSKAVIPKDGRLCLAFSGGSDSLALLSLLPKERSFAVYVDHNIRGREELEREIELNMRNAAMFSIPMKILRVEKGEIEALSRAEGIGVEAAARKIRYRLLLGQQADYILTAHHMDDQAETLLMRLLSGAPLYRLEGIRAVYGRIVRPLLSVEKELITSYLKEAGLQYSSDSTNSDESYRRNYIRRNILPLLSLDEKRCLLNISLNIQNLNARESKIEIIRGFCYCIEREAFLKSTTYSKENAVFRINGDMGFSSLLSRSECSNIFSAVRDGRSYESSRFIVKTDSAMVRFFPKGYNVIHDGSESFVWNGLAYSVSKKAEDDKTLLIDFSEVRGPLIFRNSREGDEILLKEGRKKVRDLAKEYRLPYLFVLEDRISIVAVFARAFGGRDRLARRFIGRNGRACSLTEIKTVLN